MERGGTITWVLTALDGDFDRAADRVERRSETLGRNVDRNISKGTKNANVSLQDFNKELGHSATVFRNFQIAIRGFQANALVIGATTAAGALVELAGALTAAAGAALAVPGIIAPVVGAFGTVKVATSGMSDAFKALAKGDLDKLNEALAKLSPNARDFVKSAGDVQKAFKSIQQAVQDSFFAGLGAQLKEVANVNLPSLRAGLLSVSASMNGLLKETARIAKQPFFQGLISDTLNTTAKSTDILSKAVEPLLRAFAGLVEIGLPYTTMLAEWVVNQAKIADSFINSAKGQQTLTDSINLGIGAIQKLFGLVGAVSSLLLSLFQVSNKEGLSFIDTLTDIVNSTNEWVKSAEGQKLLTSLFEAANFVLKDLAKVAGEFAVALLYIVDAYNSLDGPAKELITNLLIFSALSGPLLSYLSAQYASFKLVFLAGREAYQGIRAAIIGAKEALDGYKAAQAGLKIGKDFDGGGFTKFGTVVSDVIDKVLKLGAIIVPFFASVIPGALASAGAAISTFFLTTLPGLIASAGGAIASAFLAITPVGWVIIIVAAVVALFVFLYTKFEGFRDFVNGIWSAIVGFATKAFEGIGNFFKGVWDGIVTGVTNFVNTVTAIFNTIGSVISTVVNAILTFLTPLFQIIGLIGHAIQAFGEIVFTIFSAIGQIIFTVISTIVQIIGVIFIGTIMKLWELIQFVFTNIGAFIGAAMAVVGQVITAIANTIVTVWNGIVAFLMPILTTIGEFFTTIFNAIAGVITTVFNTILDTITTIWNAIYAFLKPAIDAIAAVFTTVFNAIAGVVNKAFELIKKYIIEPIANVVDYVGRTIGQIAKFIGDAVTNAYNSVAGFIDRFTQAGHNIIDGIVNGIKSGAGAVVDFIKNVCANALNTVKSFFGIHSPSKVMASMGNFMMEGLQKGIEQAGQAVIDTSTQVADGIASAFARPLDPQTITANANLNTDVADIGGITQSVGAAITSDTGAASSTASGVVINQTNNVNTDLDMDQVNRNLAWELHKI